jgi:hypothetical protein
MTTNPKPPSNSPSLTKSSSSPSPPRRKPTRTPTLARLRRNPRNQQPAPQHPIQYEPRSNQHQIDSDMDERLIADFAYNYNDGRKSQSTGVQIENRPIVRRQISPQTRPSQSQRRRLRSPIHLHPTRLPTNLRARNTLLPVQASEEATVTSSPRNIAREFCSALID